MTAAPSHARRPGSAPSATAQRHQLLRLIRDSLRRCVRGALAEGGVRATARLTPATKRSWARHGPDRRGDDGRRLHFLRPSGDPAPQAVTVGPDGRIWFTGEGTDANGNAASFVGAIATDGSVSEYQVPPSSSGALDPGATGITLGPDGRLWFAETAAGSIGAVTTGGSFAEYGQGSGIGPEHLASGQDGAIWFTDGSGIGRITTSGVVRRFQPQNCSGCNDVNGVTAGPDGRIWYTQNYYGNGSVVAMTASGQITRFNVPNQGHEVFWFADAITAGPDGRMWFAEVSGGAGTRALAALSLSAVGGSGPTSLACHVPKVIGKTLAAARRAIVRAGCKVGKVTHKAAVRKKRGRVLSQRPRAGRKEPLGARVKIVVGQ